MVQVELKAFPKFCLKIETRSEIEYVLGNGDLGIRVFYVFGVYM